MCLFYEEDESLGALLSTRWMKDQDSLNTIFGSLVAVAMLERVCGVSACTGYSCCACS